VKEKSKQGRKETQGRYEGKERERERERERRKNEIETERGDIRNRNK
jgi:hypothetical protein